MSAVPCLPACLCVSTAASRGQAPHGNASVCDRVQRIGDTQKSTAKAQSAKRNQQIAQRRLSPPAPMVDPPDNSDRSPTKAKGADDSRPSSLSQPASSGSPEKSPSPHNTPQLKKGKDTAPPQSPTPTQKNTPLFSSPSLPKPDDVHSTSAPSYFSPLPHLPTPRFSNPTEIHPSNKSRLCNELETNNLPDLFDFQQASNNVYSNKQMAYPPQEIGNLFNELDGVEVAIFQTDWENPFGNMYKPYYKTDTVNKKNALQNAKYVTAANGFSQQNIESVLQASTTKTFIATPILSEIYDNDAQNNTYARCLTLFNALHNQAQQNHYYRGYRIVNQPDPLTTPSNFNIWDYRSFVLKFHRYLTDVDIRHTYTPWLPDTTAPVTTLKEATFPRAQGFMVLTLDTTKTSPSTRLHHSHWSTQAFNLAPITTTLTTSSKDSPLPTTSTHSPKHSNQ